jgi:aminopeptidase YwaD
MRMQQRLTAASICAAALLLAGCFALEELDSAQTSLILDAVGAVNSSRLTSSLQALETLRLPPHAPGDCLPEILSQFTAAGYPAAAVLPGTWENVLAELPGAESGLAPVSVMAHWDFIVGPGADDDASGVAGVIEISRALAATGHQFRRTIRFLLFGGEEGLMLGSRQYAAGLAAGDVPDFFINLDMIGYTSSQPDSLGMVARQEAGNYIGAFGPEWAAESVVEFARDTKLFVSGLRFYATTVPGGYQGVPLLDNAARGDQDTFWNLGAHGLVLSTGERNPNYHGGTDTLSTLDLPFMTAVVKAALATVCVRADR